MTSLLSSESLDDLTSLTLIAIRNSPQPATGYAKQPALCAAADMSIYQHRPALMTSIPDQHWFCQFSSDPTAQSGIPADPDQTNCCPWWPETFDLRHPTLWANVKAMSINPTPRIVTELKPKFRSQRSTLTRGRFCFPRENRSANCFSVRWKNDIPRSDLPVLTNRAHHRACFVQLEDAREFGRRLIDAVHCARTQLVVTQGIRVSINVVANGYHLQFGDMNNATELFLVPIASGRVCQVIAPDHGLIFARRIQLIRRRSGQLPTPPQSTARPE